jgi:hypothetical protein
MTGDDVILPVLHGVRPSDIANVSPPLADLLAADTANGIDVITRQIGRTLDKRRGSPFWLCHLLDVRADDAQSLAGSTLHLCYRIENENSEAAHIWLGASLVGAGRHEFCDPANDIRVDVAPGEDEYGRRFALPADLEAASYRLIGGLWLNRVGSGGERIHTRSASRPVVVQGESSD